MTEYLINPVLIHKSSKASKQIIEGNLDGIMFVKNDAYRLQKFNKFEVAIQFRPALPNHHRYYINNGSVIVSMIKSTYLKICAFTCQILNYRVDSQQVILYNIFVSGYYIMDYSDA